ncbi:MAG: pyruvate kinase alpha/beta domain-containing protein [Bacillota bacterium]
MIFDAPGQENTAKAVQAAVERARQLGIRQIVAASYRGTTARELLPYAQEFDIVIVGQVYGFRGLHEENPMTEPVKAQLKGAGLQLLFATHALSGAERSLSSRFSGIYPVEVMAHTLRMFGQGTKVCVEISCMAMDAGLIAPGQDIVAIAGTGKGADTALVLRPAHTQRVIETKIQEIICKPRLVD